MMIRSRQNWLKRSLSLFLALVLCVSMFTANVSAEEETQTVHEQLEALLTEIDGLNRDDYIEAAYDNLKEQADSVCRPVDPNEMPEFIAEYMIELLTEMKAGLVRKDSAWGQLEILLDEIYALDSDDYSEESYNALIEQADSVCRPVDPNEMPEFIAVYMTEILQNLMDSLEPGKTVYEKLEEKLAEAEALNAADYTKESWKAVADIIEVIDRPVSADNITEKLAAKMLSDLEEALAALEAAPEEEIVLENGTYSAALNYSYYAWWHDDNVKIVAEDGKYAVTFYMKYDEIWEFNGDMYSNQQYHFRGKQDFRIVLAEVMKTTEDPDGIGNYYAEKNLIDSYDMNGSGYSDTVKEKVSAEYNDMFYDTEYSVMEDGTLAFTVVLDSLNDVFCLNALEEYDRHYYESDDVQTYYDELRHSSVSIDTDSIEKMPETFENISSTVSFNYDEDNIEYFSRSNEAYAVSENGKLYVTYSVSPDSWINKSKNGLSVEVLDGNYEPIEIQDGKITIEYNNIDEVIYGSTVIIKTLRKDSYRGIVYGYSTLWLSPYLNTTPITLVDEATGIKLLTNSKYVSDGAALNVEIIKDTGSSDTKTDAWANFESHVSSYNEVTFFRFSVSDNGSTVTDFGSNPMLEIPISEDMNKNSMRAFINQYVNESGIKNFMYGWFNSNGIVQGDVYLFLVDKDYVTANWAIYDEKLTDKDGSDLEDGTYIVPITTFNEAAPDQTSMSAQCIGTEAVLVVKDGVKRLELNFLPVSIGENNGYLIQMWSQNSDGEYEELTYTSYYKNEDGSYYTDEVNEGTTDYYPMTGYMILPSDDAQFITKFRVSAMDAIIEGIATRNAIFTIYYDDAVKVSDETPDPAPEEVIGGEEADKSVLESLIEEASAYEEAGYTPSTYTVLVSALEAAKLVDSNSKASQTAVDEAAETLRNAIDGLVKMPAEEININNLPDGKYTLYAQMIKTDRLNFSMSDNAINHNVWLEVIDGEYYLTMQFKGLSIYNKFGYLMNLSYFDEGYTYNEYGVPEGTLVSAEVISTYDVVDAYNDAEHLYPELLRIRLVDKAGEKYVPLQVFVPIMEEIADETGTQAVLMQLDWTTLKVDNGEIQPDDPVEQSPAVDYTDTETGVKVYADKGVFEEGVQIVVTGITTGNNYDNAAAALSDIGEKFSLYDVKFYNTDGEEVAPNGTVTISFPIPEKADAETIAVYRINEDGSRTLVKGIVEGNYYSVVTRTAAMYSLVETGSTAEEGNGNDNEQVGGTENNNASTPKTGDTADLTLWFGLMLASAGMVSAALYLKKREAADGK